jgi:hypothetical protein
VNDGIFAKINESLAQDEDIAANFGRASLWQSGSFGIYLDG